MSDIDLDRLKTAFHYHVLQSILAADARLFREEIWLLERAKEKMIEADLMDGSGVLKSGYEEAVEAARTELAERLDHDGKLEILGALYDASGIDGDRDETEQTTLFAAAQVLGLSSDAFYAALKTFAEEDAEG